jgi:hypothetical protein
MARRKLESFVGVEIITLDQGDTHEGVYVGSGVMQTKRGPRPYFVFDNDSGRFGIWAGKHFASLMEHAEKGLQTYVTRTAEVLETANGEMSVWEVEQDDGK